MKDNKKYYDLTASQRVVKLQCKYTLFKRVINIISGSSTKEEIDRDLMKKAVDILIERNDCLRLRFVKQKGQIKQYVEEKVDIGDIPYLQFSTEKEQNAFINKIKVKATKYLKGETFIVYFIKTFDNRFMVLLKVCHLILDLYGINIIYKDLFDVYYSLKNNSPLPPPTGNFEKIIQSELNKLHNKEKFDEEAQFFTKYLSERERPKYAGVHGKELPRWQKLQKKGHFAMQMFFIKCDTQGAVEIIEKEHVDKLIDYCNKTNISISNVLYYLTLIATSKLNDTYIMLPLELCNCRGTLSEKKAAGIKVQTIGCYAKVMEDKTFNENMAEFMDMHNELYRHVGFDDVTYQKILNKVYNKPFLQILYPYSYSFVPLESHDGFDFQIFSNGKGALPCYFCYMFDIKAGKIIAACDYQTKIITRENVTRFNDVLVKIIDQTMLNPEIKIKDIKI